MDLGFTILVWLVLILFGYWYIPKYDIGHCNAMCWDTEFKRNSWSGVILLTLFGFAYAVPLALFRVMRRAYEWVVLIAELALIFGILCLLFLVTLLDPKGVEELFFDEESWND